MSTSAAVGTCASPKRAYALDALRGSAILMMVLNELNPSGPHNSLPSYMYHAQVPPPKFVFNPNLPGVTWVDMVLPFFLFAMGAAIPFTMGRRMEKGTPRRGLVLSTILRALLLGLFAFYVEHIKTAAMVGNPLQLFLTGITGFLLLFLILGRLPSEWKPSVRGLLKAAGWIAAIALLFFARYKDEYGLRFSIDRYDVIIVILANVALYTTLIYLFTRNNLLMRVGFLGILMALKLGSSVPGWVNSLYANYPIPYVNNMTSLGHTAVSILKAFSFFYSIGITHYLFIAIPGTIVGDMILTWMNTPEDEKQTWSGPRYAGFALFLFSTIVLCLCLLKGRYVTELVISLIPILLLGKWLTRAPVASIEKLIHDLYRWGAYFLILGMIFEPYEGGIKKDSATMSYFMVSAGLAIFTLLVYTILIDVFRKKHALQLLIDNGQNPMIAYTAAPNFVGLILTFTGVNRFLAKTIVAPWPSFFCAICITMIVALCVSFCTRKKIFWRT